MGRLMKIAGRKGAQDARRGKIFTKLIREISVAARQGGGDPGGNPRLRLAMDKALDANMAKDVIERAIKKATGGLEGVNYEELRYEGYAPGGVAVIVDCMTENKVRTVGEVRHAFSKCGGNLGTDGSVAYLFERKGQISFAPGVDEDALTEAALEADADDVVSHEDGSIDVFTSFTGFYAVRNALEAAGFKGDDAEIVMQPTTSAELDLEGAEKVLKLIDMLEDLDDVQNVYSNADIPEDVAAQLG